MREARGIAALRATYRPATVRVLLIGESAPAGGTHYERANSNLHRAIREAFVRVYGSRTPVGNEFLAFAQVEGLWLIDLASKPVNSLPNEERRRLVRSGASKTARQIRDTQPAFVISIKASIAGVVADCVERSGIDPEFVALPFPLMQWREEFVTGLASVLRRDRIRRRSIL